MRRGCRWRPNSAQAVERKELELFYQPQVGLKDGKLVGAEALIRWRHPVRGLVSPAEFMPLVNASSISDRVALWVMETACRQGRRWQQRAMTFASASICRRRSFNPAISRRRLRRC